MSVIPVIDLSEMGNEQGRKRISQDLFDAYSTLGFAILTNHGIDGDLIDAAFDVSREFHDLKHDQKMEVYTGSKLSGYTPGKAYTSRVLDGEKTRSVNFFEAYVYHDEVNLNSDVVYNEMNFSVQNRWPATLPKMQSVCEKLLFENKRLAFELMRLLTTGLGFSQENVVLNMLPHAHSVQRLQYYPKSMTESRAAPHTDLGLITLLLQDQVGGLQVRDPGGESWIDVKTSPYQIVMNVGNTLERLSNGLLRSTPHRVVGKKECERYSLPFFYLPNTSFDVKPLERCVALRENKSYFDAVNFGEYCKAYINDKKIA